MLANICLKRNGHPITEWPEATISFESVIRDEHLAAIQSSDHGDETALIELHRRFTPRPVN
jgi:hypothetical protein